jgi:hypothetical protein
MKGVSNSAKTIILSNLVNLSQGENPVFYLDFPSIPLILVITLQNRKTLFCVFLRFRDLPILKLTQDYWSANILPREAPRAQEVNERRPKA